MLHSTFHTPNHSNMQRSNVHQKVHDFKPTIPFLRAYGPNRPNDSAYLRAALQRPDAEPDLLKGMLRGGLSFMSKCMIWSLILGSEQSVTFAAPWLELAYWNVIPLPGSLNLKPNEILKDKHNDRRTGSYRAWTTSGDQIMEYFKSSPGMMQCCRLILCIPAPGLYCAQR